MLSFLLGTLAALIMLFVPGYLLLRQALPSRVLTLSLAPAATMFMAVLLGIIFKSTHIALPIFVLFVASGLIGLVAYALGVALRLKKGAISFKEALLGPLDTTYKDLSLGKLGVYWAFACALLWYMYLSISGYGQGWYANVDMFWHLDVIRTFLDTQFASPVNVDIYPFDQVASYTGTISYPSAWHTLAAAIVSLTNIGVPQASNVVNFVMCGFAFPLACLVLIWTLFPENKKALWLGALVVMGFGVFPWRLFVFGPLLPNMAAFSMAPAGMALFIFLFKEGMDKAYRLRLGLIFMLVMAGIAATHPNTVFSMGFLLMPFLAYQTYRLFVFMSKKFASGISKRMQIIIGLLGYVACFALCMIVWALMFNVPSIADVSTSPPPTFTSLKQGLARAVLVAYQFKFFQLALALCILVGLVKVFKQPSLRWLIVSWFLVVVQFGISASLEGPVRVFVTGFWYNDITRIAVHGALIGIPLAAVGASAILSWLERLFSTDLARVLGRCSCVSKRLTSYDDTACAASVFISAAFVIVLGLGIYMPSINLGSALSMANFSSVTKADIRWWYTPSAASYSNAERDFVAKVNEIVAKDAKRADGTPRGVLNMPYDGSGFAYSVTDANTFYRRFNDIGGSETEASKLLRLHINEVATNAYVREALAQTGISYVMLLDAQCPDAALNEEERELFQARLDSLPEDAERPTISPLLFQPRLWTGILSVHDSTPGFTKVLEEGDMVLYRIDAAF